MKIYEACTKTHAKGTTHWHPLRFREPETDIDDLANKMYVAAVQPESARGVALGIQIYD